MFKKIKKIGICWVLFIALFSLKNYAASFTYNGYTYSYQTHLTITGWWGEKDGQLQLLTADILSNYLWQQKNEILRELKRLLLAQDNGGIRANNDINKFLSLPTVQNVKVHMFDHGHMGWYPFSSPYQQDSKTCVQKDPLSTPRGIFNISHSILADIRDHIDPLWMRQSSVFHKFSEGYSISQELDKTANNIITSLFFKNITQTCVQNPDITESFAIYVIYRKWGQYIPGLQGEKIGLETFLNKTTDKACIVAEVIDGKINLVTIYPLDDRRRH